MVSMTLHLRNAGTISKALLDTLVCPLSKQPLRYCQETQCLISDAIGVSFRSCFPGADNTYYKFSLLSLQEHIYFLQVVDGIPCLVPKDGKIIEVTEKTTSTNDPSQPFMVADHNL